MREMAMERGISLIDLGREAEMDGGLIDRTLDARQIELGKQENDFIIDGRLAFYFIPQSVKIFLRVDALEAARRIFHDESHGRTVENHSSIEEAAKNIEIRRQSEDDRYSKYYGIHIYDMSFYDIVVDTTSKTPEQVFELVMEQIRKIG